MLRGPVEHRRRKSQGAEGAEGVGCGKVSPSSLGEGSGRGLCPLPRKFLTSGKQCFGAFWVLLLQTAVI